MLLVVGSELAGEHDATVVQQERRCLGQTSGVVVVEGVRPTDPGSRQGLVQRGADRDVSPGGVIQP